MMYVTHCPGRLGVGGSNPLAPTTIYSVFFTRSGIVLGLHLKTGFRSNRYIEHDLSRIRFSPFRIML
ncbi:hypothetical protein GGQ85_001655 [Nitrobacter vulgaris]|nr:hypothetical protein [Nitrobacter vulgaris]